MTFLRDFRLLRFVLCLSEKSDLYTFLGIFCPMCEVNVGLGEE